MTPLRISNSATLLLLLVVIAATLPTSVLVVAQTPQLLWSDEFNNEDGVPSEGTWNLRTGDGGWGNGELQTYTTTNAAVNADNLEITVTQRNSDDLLFTSARLDTANKVHVQYGVISARIWVPNVDAGLWPAFWLLGGDFFDVPWPQAGEINIMEMGQGLAIEGGLANQRVISGAHWEHNDEYATYAGARDFGEPLNAGYQVFTLDWTPEFVTTYVNDTEVWKMDIKNCEDCEEFHKPHFMVLNIAVGGGFTSGGGSTSSGCGSSSAGDNGCPNLRGPDDITAPLPAKMLVDWVRIYDNGHTSLTAKSNQQPLQETDQSAASPVMSPVTTPVQSPVASPECQACPPAAPLPVAPPVQSPVASPVSQALPPTAALPVSLPVAPPVQTPVQSPVSTPVTPPSASIPPPVAEEVQPPVTPPPVPVIPEAVVPTPPPIVEEVVAPLPTRPTSSGGKSGSGKSGKSGSKSSKSSKSSKGSSSSSERTNSLSISGSITDARSKRIKLATTATAVVTAYGLLA